MMDQATELRKLVLRSMREKSVVAGPAPRLMVLGAGKGGVGVTTLAINLSIALAEQGARVVVVDADLYRSDVVALCGVTERESVVDVLIARRDIHQVLQRGPGGIQIVPGLWAPGETTECSEMAQDRLLRQFKTLGPHADVVMLDVGSGSAKLVRHFCSAASDVLLVTTPDTVAVMDTYARVKSSMSGMGPNGPQIIVNRCPDSDQATDVHRRIHQSCQRFLGMNVRLLGYLPEDEGVRQAAEATVPFMVGSPTCQAARAVHRMATTLWSEQPDSLSRAA